MYFHKKNRKKTEPTEIPIYLFDSPATCCFNKKLEILVTTLNIGCNSQDSPPKISRSYPCAKKSAAGLLFSKKHHFSQHVKVSAFMHGLIKPRSSWELTIWQKRNYQSRHLLHPDLAAGSLNFNWSWANLGYKPVGGSWTCWGIWPSEATTFRKYKTTANCIKFNIFFLPS